MSDNEPIISVTAEPNKPAASKRPFARSSLTAMIIGGLVFVLSGLCTGGFALYPLFQKDGFSEFLNFLLVPLGLGAMGFIPGLLLFFTGKHIRDKGPSLGAGLIIIVLALPPLFVRAIWPFGIIISVVLLYWAAQIIRQRVR